MLPSGDASSAREYRALAGGLGLALLLLVAPAAAESGIELAVLSYNVHGLPAWIAGDQPAARMPRIAARAADYDLVLLQEDFAHHDVLRPGLRQPLVWRGNGTRFGRLERFCPVCGGSGLTLIADLAEAALRPRHNVAYATCSGWLGGANDCLATKGFQHARLQLGAGVVLDVVNTHLDAGDSSRDLAARAAQLDELSAHVAAESADHALLVAGDLNLARDRPEDVALLQHFRRTLGLRDSGAAPAHDGWRHLDWLLVRDGTELRIEVLEAGEDARFAEAGAPLSDHPALYVRLRLVRRPPAD